MNRTGADGAELAESWVEHLRGGGTTPWPRWVRRARSALDVSGTVAAPGVPGAAQLELLRRLNELGPLPHRTDHVLRRPGPGRGPVHLQLPLDPATTAAPRREVVRVAAGVLADLTAQLPPPRRRRRRWWVRRPRPVEGVPRFVLEGPPVTVAEVRAQLAASGLVEHQPGGPADGPDPGPELVLVLVTRLDEALREAWTSRVQHGTGRAWPRFVTLWAGSGSLPPSVAVDRTVGYWADRVGIHNVHLVVLDQATGSVPAAQVAEVLGRPLTDTPAGGPRPGDPLRLPAAMVDVLRRVNLVLTFLCSEVDRELRRAALVGLMREVGARAEPTDLPERRRPWAAAAASRLVDALEESGAVVHGDLAALRTLGPVTGRQLGRDEVLDVMVRMIHRVDAELVGGSHDGRGGR